MQQQHVEILGAQRSQRLVDRVEDVLLREVPEPVPDSDLGLDDDRFAVGGREGDRVAEALLASVVTAVHVGMVEVVDAGVTCRTNQVADGLIVELGDPHQPQDHVRGVEGGLRWGEGLHHSSSFLRCCGWVFGGRDAGPAHGHDLCGQLVRQWRVREHQPVVDRREQHIGDGVVVEARAHVTTALALRRAARRQRRGAARASPRRARERRPDP